jgi:uncharacterized protein YkwD
MKTKSVLLVALGACCQAFAGCAGPSDEGTANLTSALGQPSGDFPSYDERVVHYATNRARMSPTAEGWPTYPAQPPMQWNLSLNQSSRAHSLDMRDTPCFQHPSCGSATDDTFTRVLRFYTGAWTNLGENIAGGPADGITVVHNWIYEIGAAAGETGHRDSIFSARFNLIGNGYAPGGMPRPALNNLWTQDFVATTIPPIPKMTDGIHFPATVAAGGSVTFGTTYYDATGAAPSRIMVVVDGACTPMALATLTGMPRGTAGKGAYEVAVPLAAGCHPYYFLATAGGTDVTYPDSGALQAGVAVTAGSCALFTTTRSAAVCGGGGLGGATGAGGTGATGGTSGAGGATGAGGTTGTGGTVGGGGATGAGGRTGTGGTVGGGGATGAGGRTGTGGVIGVGGGTGVGGAVAPGSGGGPGTAGVGGSGSGVGTGMVAGGCGCDVPSRGEGSGVGTSVIAGLMGLVLVRRRRLSARSRMLRRRVA